MIEIFSYQLFLGSVFSLSKIWFGILVLAKQYATASISELLLFLGEPLASVMMKSFWISIMVTVVGHIYWVLFNLLPSGFLHILASVFA